ncbi:enoyl-CoA hydratase/isomerase family protein [Mameliella alba]|uniref:enoyl-CoA hydratase/isomerase family protein n=1 Tax=Mameliella alba TaxID=561184 RepID=UPI0017C88897|nr:enoyl-CoA hydratase-related protein [Mameliella alba]MBY6121112.1 enoyl-CoA hydratase/isomerase family protein [Mameliella alba]
MRSRPDRRALVITGAGTKAFSAGADIDGLAGRGLVDELDGTLKGQRVFDRLSRLRQPLIAYVNGYALGGGCELALACTFRVAAPRARLGLSEVKLGLVPGYGGTQRLIGTGRALDLMLSDDMLGAEDALAMGLINRMIPEDKGLDGALAYAARFADKSPVAMSLIRESVRQGMDLTLDNGLAIEVQNSVLSYRTADGQEGLNAFLTKRSPQFKDERHGHATRRRKE